MTVIWWIRRDVQLRDAPALYSSLAHGPVVPVFILDDVLLKNAPLMKKNFLFGALRSLDTELHQRGARLIVREGRPIEVLRRLCAAVGAERVIAEADNTPYAQRRDQQVAQEVQLELVPGQTVYHRRWVPELRDVPAPAIHAPWEKGIIVPGYPSRPIMDHAAAIRRVRLAYETTRDQMSIEGI